MLTVKIEGNKIHSPLRNQMLTLIPEERVRQAYICHLVNHYGYSLDQMGEEVLVSNSQRGLGKARADIVIWKSKEDKEKNRHAFIVIECKAQNVKIQRQDYFQGANYASWTHAQFFITTNEKETKFFKTGETIPVGFLDEINDIPSAKDIGNDKKIAEILSQTKTFTRDEFQNLLLQCHNVIRNNDKLSPEMAFDEISKILFIKIRYERNVGKGSLFTKERFEILRSNDDETRSKTDSPFYQKLFEKTKEDFRYAEIFEENDSLRIRETSFLQIVNLLEKYNLSDTSDDVKGIAFEQFLGRTFRGDLGQFFTPRTIVRFMTEILDPREGELICDPCCGTGGFLINAFEYIRTQIEDDIEGEKKNIRNNLLGADIDSLSPEEGQKILDNIDEKTQSTIDSAFAKLNQELDPNYEGGRLYQLSRDYIFGTDAEPRSARTAKMNMIMHGDGHAGVHHHDGLLNVNGIFESRFDVILTNPPFGARVSKDLLITDTDRYTDEKRIRHYTDLYGDQYLRALEQVTGNIGKSVLDLYDLGSVSSLTEVLFMERNLRLLKSGGRMGVVLPDGVLNTSQLQSVREYFEGRARILFIVSIPQDVFMAAGATVKSSLLFLKKFTDAETVEYEKISGQAKIDIASKYKSEKESLEKVLKSGSREEKLTAKKSLKTLEETITKEIRSTIKTAWDYEIAVAQVDKAGISTTGGVIENELETVLKTFRQYKGHEISFISNIENNKHLKFTHLSKFLDTWTLPYADEEVLLENHSFIKIGELLHKSINSVSINDSETYNRITIKLYGKGVSIRDTVIGKVIGTKKQWRVKAGQFIISKIDARNGAFGVVPPQCDLAIATNDFPSFDVDTTKITAGFLNLITSTKKFNMICERASTGTTGRRRVDMKKFLEMKIQIPPLAIQLEIMGKIGELQKNIDLAQLQVERLKKDAMAGFESNE